MDGHVRIERQSGALAITLARPERRNAITVAMYAALADAIEGAAKDPSVRLISIRGEGQDFTSGNDLADFLAAIPRVEEIPVMRLLRALARNPKPIVAAVHGNAVGIGTTLLLHCDLVIAEESARFTMPFVDLGLVPEAASSLLLPRLAGRRRAAAWLLLGESFGSAEAREAGVVSHIVADGESPAALGEMTGRLLAKPAEALQITQDLLRRGNSDEIVERIDVESDYFSERLKSDEVKGAIQAFFQRKAGG
jgi:enoyl-CoA hydratase/carnithine racemase